MPVRAKRGAGHNKLKDEDAHNRRLYEAGWPRDNEGIGTVMVETQKNGAHLKLIERVKKEKMTHLDQQLEAFESAVLGGEAEGGHSQAPWTHPLPHHLPHPLDLPTEKKSVPKIFETLPWIYFVWVL